mmetsp:Transcript_12677/g.20690  ORF Transcript_12677/g.20690 Transcript_12677/m.20690 type:complete len:1346 (+) Transcript_12677:78-4115(+)
MEASLCQAKEDVLQAKAEYKRISDRYEKTRVQYEACAQDCERLEDVLDQRTHRAFVERDRLHEHVIGQEKLLLSQSKTVNLELKRLLSVSRDGASPLSFVGSRTLFPGGTVSSEAISFCKASFRSVTPSIISLPSHSETFVRQLHNILLHISRRPTLNKLISSQRHTMLLVFFLCLSPFVASLTSDHNDSQRASSSLVLALSCLIRILMLVLFSKHLYSGPHIDWSQWMKSTISSMSSTHQARSRTQRITRVIPSAPLKWRAAVLWITPFAILGHLHVSMLYSHLQHAWTASIASGGLLGVSLSVIKSIFGWLVVAVHPSEVPTAPSLINNVMLRPLLCFPWHLLWPDSLFAQILCLLLGTSFILMVMVVYDHREMDLTKRTLVIQGDKITLQIHASFAQNVGGVLVGSIISAVLLTLSVPLVGSLISCLAIFALALAAYTLFIVLGPWASFVAGACSLPLLAITHGLPLIFLESYALAASIAFVVSLRSSSTPSPTVTCTSDSPTCTTPTRGQSIRTRRRVSGRSLTPTPFSSCSMRRGDRPTSPVEALRMDEASLKQQSRSLGRKDSVFKYLSMHTEKSIAVLELRNRAQDLVASSSGKRSVKPQTRNSSSPPPVTTPMSVRAPSSGDAGSSASSSTSSSLSSLPSLLTKPLAPTVLLESVSCKELPQQRFSLETMDIPPLPVPWALNPMSSMSTKSPSHHRSFSMDSSANFERKDSVFRYLTACRWNNDPSAAENNNNNNDYSQLQHLSTPELLPPTSSSFMSEDGEMKSSSDQSSGGVDSVLRYLALQSPLQIITRSDSNGRPLPISTVSDADMSEPESAGHHQKQQAHLLTRPLPYPDTDIDTETEGGREVTPAPGPRINRLELSRPASKNPTPPGKRSPSPLPRSPTPGPASSQAPTPNQAQKRKVLPRVKSRESRPPSSNALGSGPAPCTPLNVLPSAPPEVRNLLPAVDDAQADETWTNLGVNGDSGVVDLSFRPIMSDELLLFGAALKINTTITQMTLRKNSLGDTGALIVAEAMKFNTRLQCLNVEGNNIGNTGTASFAECLRLNTTLQVLALKRNEITEAGARCLASVLRVNTTLTSLDLAVNNIGTVGAIALSEVIKDNRGLKTLRVSYNNIQDRGTQAIMEALHTNQYLYELDISGNPIGPVGAAAIRDALKKNGYLEKFVVWGTQLGDRGAKCLSEGIRSNTALTKLYIQNNQIGDTGAMALSEAIKTNHQLRTLNLEGNRIGNWGARALGQSLSINESLNTLDLYANGIGGQGAKAIADGLMSNKALTKLGLDIKQIGPEGAASLNEVLKVNTTLVCVDLYQNANKAAQANMPQIAAQTPLHGRRKSVQI